MLNLLSFTSLRSGHRLQAINGVLTVDFSSLRCSACKICMELGAYILFLSHAGNHLADNGLLLCFWCCCNLLPIHDICQSVHFFSRNYHPNGPWWGFTQREWYPLWNASDGSGDFLSTTRSLAIFTVWHILLIGSLPFSAQAYKANVVCPNKNQADPEKFYQNQLLESETYIGGHVECLESGVFRSDIPTSFKLDSLAYQASFLLHIYSI